VADYPPIENPDGGATVSPAQLRIHKTTEAASVLVGVPLLLWVATRPRKLTRAERGAVMSFAVGALVVDGWLLSRW
jgi:hypothetical protein